MRRFTVALANLAALALAVAVVAYWGWRWFAPPPLPLAAPPLEDVVGALAVAPPFGASVSPPTPTAAAIPVRSGEARLLGVLAEREGRGRALLRLADGSARLASVGESLGAIGTLVAVHPDAVTVRDASGERRLLLRAPPSGAPTPATTRASARAAPCVPPGYRGAVARLNAELVAGLIAQPAALAAMAEAKDGALVVRDESGFAALVGLKKGDRVTQANGIALRAPEDVIIAVLRPLAANQTVRVLGMRGNEPHELLIVNVSACQ